MLKSPTSIQKQLSESVSIIGKYDFPIKWPQLIDEMVEKFSTGMFYFLVFVKKNYLIFLH